MLGAYGDDYRDPRYLRAKARAYRKHIEARRAAQRALFASIEGEPK